jgi:actin cytoskeleton-regulatory complex protein PAN1
MSGYLVTTAHALYDYAAASPEEFDLQAEAIVTVVDRSDENWWKIERDGRIGLVPATYLAEGSG